MACALILYTLSDYDRIKKEGFQYTLPEETLRTIKTIAANVGAPEYIKTPQFEKRVPPQGGGGGGHRQHRTVPREISDAEWNTLRNFKTTIIEKKKGVELSIDKIRKHLNKMTDKTYDTMKTQIMAEIDLILGEGVEEEGGEELLGELNRIGDALFEIASGNSFYSKMYATLYKELMDKYAFMKAILATRLAADTDRSILTNFEYCDPNKDYDQFCKNIKINEKRRALGLFYVNMMLLGIIPVSKIISMIEELQTDLFAFIKKEQQANSAEEIAELLFILITNSVAKVKQAAEWTQIRERVHLISEMKAKSLPSISNKTIFRHMDIKTHL